MFELIKSKLLKCNEVLGINKLNNGQVYVCCYCNTEKYKNEEEFIKTYEYLVR